MRRGGCDDFPDNGFEAWGGYMQAKIAKLEEQYSKVSKEESQLSNIFKSVSIFVNGYTIPSADELKTLMSQHGGIYHSYKRQEDFIIASNLPDTKVKNMSLSKVVRPEWITDSIAANRLLDYREYLLYKEFKTQPRLKFNKLPKNTIDSEGAYLKIEGLKCETDLTNCLSEAAIAEDVEQSKLSDCNSMIKTAVDPNFISEFYSNSRLHHISQLGACFKQYVNDLRENSEFKFPAREQLKEQAAKLEGTKKFTQIVFDKNKVIMHIDMDCFFVSVGLRNRPHLVGKPVAVTHSKGGHSTSKRSGVDRSTEFSLYKDRLFKKRTKNTGNDADKNIEIESRVDNIGDEDEQFGSMSEIASCSYEARAKGIKNGMFMGAALRLCPDLNTIPYDFEGYREVSYSLYNTIAQYTLDIEAVSCDEMYVDCTALLRDLDINVQDFASLIRNEIKSKTGCPCSTGFGGNRLQARLATKKAKPDGQFFLTADIVDDFMYEIQLEELPGVGRQIACKLKSLGHQTCGTLQGLSVLALQQHFGSKTGTHLYNQCRGRDDNPLQYHTIRKSVSAEVNYGIRFENIDQCYEFLRQLSTEVHSRMKQFKVLGKCISLKLMVRAEKAPIETAKFMGHGFCDVINKSTALSYPTNNAEIISKEVILLCKKIGVDAKEMRGVGIQITKLEPITHKEKKGGIGKFLCNKKVKTYNSESENTVSTSNPSTTIKTASIASPLNKSPVLISFKSPKRKRGRPPKNLCLRQQPTSNSNISKFLNGTYDTPYRNPMIKSDQTNKVKEEETSEKQNDSQFKDKPAGLLALSWQEVRELLRAWLESGQTPLQCDVQLITEYMSHMIVKRNIDNLYILLNFLSRRIKAMSNNAWIRVFDHIIENVQIVMLDVYGKKLYINSEN